MDLLLGSLFKKKSLQIRVSVYHPVTGRTILIEFELSSCQCDQIGRVFFNFWPFQTMKITPKNFAKY